MKALDRRREFALWVSRATGDWRAISTGDPRRMAKRGMRRAAGRWTGKMMRRYLN